MSVRLYIEVVYCLFIYFILASGRGLVLTHIILIYVKSFSEIKGLFYEILTEDVIIIYYLKGILYLT